MTETITIHTDNWVDAQAMHDGQILKVCARRERFWTHVMWVDEEGVVARVGNDLIGDMPYNFDDLVRFQPEHVFAFWDDPTND